MIDSKAPGIPSSLHILRTLLAKDWRLYRLAVMGSLVLGGACYVVAIAAVLCSDRDKGLLYLDDVLKSLCIAAFVACVLTSPLASVFGGGAIAGERSNRTGEFLALLPVTRMQIILSKWMVSILFLIGCAGIHLIILATSWFIAIPSEATVHQFARGTHRGAAELAIATVCWIGFTASFFGIGWLLSTFTKSEFISASMSLVITFAAAAFFVLALAAYGFLYTEGRGVMLSLAAILLAIGLSSAVGGAIYYLRRIAP